MEKKRRRNKLISIAVCLCMVLALLPAASFAVGATSYTAYDSKNEKEISVTGFTKVTESTTNWTGGATAEEATWYVVDGDVTIDTSVDIDGYVNLLLNKGTLKIHGKNATGPYTADDETYGMRQKQYEAVVSV